MSQEQETEKKKIESITDNTFESEVLKSEKPVLVYFFIKTLSKSFRRSLFFSAFCKRQIAFALTFFHEPASYFKCIFKIGGGGNIRQRNFLLLKCIMQNASWLSFHIA